MKKSISLLTICLVLFLTISRISFAHSALDETRSSLDYTGILAMDFDGDGNDEIIGDFGPNGIWKYETSTQVWTKICGANPEWIIVVDLRGGEGEELIADFGSAGLWFYTPLLDNWQVLSYNNPDFALVVDDDGDGDEEIIADFDASGVWLYNVGPGWTKVGKANAQYGVQAKTNVGLQTDVYFDFGSLGCWWFQGSSHSWKKDSSADPEDMVAARLDPNSDGMCEAVCDFGFLSGVWIWDTLASPLFTKTGAYSPAFMQAVQFGAEDDELAAFFGSKGLWWFDPFGNGNLNGTWTQINSNWVFEVMAADLDGGDEELLSNFGNTLGIWVYSFDNGVGFAQGWTRISWGNYIAPNGWARADINGDGWEELVCNFIWGPNYGLYIYSYNSSTLKWEWARINKRNTEAYPITTNYSIRLYGTGSNDWDRIKIPVDNPPTSINVGDDFTIEFWMKADSNDNTGGQVWPGRDGWITGHIIFDRDIYGVGDYGDFGISLGKNLDKDPTGSERYIAFGVDQGGLGNGIVGNTNVADLTWHHIAVTRDGNTGDLRIFVDGLLDAELPASAARPTGDISYRDGRSGAPNDPYAVIGAEKHDVGPNYPSYNGLLEEMRVSDIVRYTSNFIPSTYEFTPDENTVALYHFNEGSGTVILDSSSFATNGTYIPIPEDQRPVWIVDSPTIQALFVFNGHDFNGNGSSDISVLRPLNGLWYIKDVGIYPWGTIEDFPINGNYDADPETEMTLWRPSDKVWYIKDIGIFQWGASGDIIYNQHL